MTDSIYRTFEDFTEGMIFALVEYEVSEAEIIEFASKYDPQVQHTNPEAAKLHVTGGLIASGWHTTAIFMRMQCDSFLTNSSSVVSPGVDDILWLKPVKPGDVLKGTSEVIKTRESQSKPDRGIIISLVNLSNQNDEAVMSMKTISILTKKL